MWQVVLVINDGNECWEQPIDGEVFDTESEADRRADELDKTIPPSWGWHGVRAVDD